jgi:hypothetical protein
MTSGGMSRVAWCPCSTRGRQVGRLGRNHQRTNDRDCLCVGPLSRIPRCAHAPSAGVARLCGAAWQSSCWPSSCPPRRQSWRLSDSSLLRLVALFRLSSVQAVGGGGKESSKQEQFQHEPCGGGGVGDFRVACMRGCSVVWQGAERNCCLEPATSRYSTLLGSCRGWRSCYSMDKLARQRSFLLSTQHWRRFAYVARVCVLSVLFGGPAWLAWVSVVECSHARCGGCATHHSSLGRM